MTSQAAVDLTRSLLVEGHLISGNGMASIGADVISGALAQVANKVAVHSVSSLGSMDNVTVLIILLQGGPAAQPDGIANMSCINNTTSSTQQQTSSIDYSRISSEYLKSHSLSIFRRKDPPSSDKMDVTGEVPEAFTTTASTRQATVLFARSTAASLPTSSSTLAIQNNGDIKGDKKAINIAPDDDDDDLLDFLNDDSNF